MCDFMYIYGESCPDYVRVGLAVVFAMAGLSTLQVLLYYGPKTLPLLRGLNLSAGISHVQQISIGLWLAFPCLFFGGLMLLFPPTTDPLSYPPAWWSVVASMSVFGLGAAFSFYIVQLYTVYWLQVLEVKRAAYEKKLASEGKAPKVRDEQKKAQMGKRILGLAKAKNKITLAAFRFTCTVCTCNVLITTYFAATLTEEEKVANGMRHAIALSFLTPGLVAAAPSYVLSTLGSAAVYLYNKPVVTLQYKLFFPVVVLLSVSYIVLAAGIAFSDDVELRGVLFLVSMSSGGGVAMFSPSQLYGLLKIPLKAKRNSKGQGGGRSNRRDSTRILREGLGIPPTPTAEGSSVREGFATAKVAPAPQETTNQQSSMSVTEVTEVE
mmetsp:Transcript_12712/g.25977  ORF Transcript_12712/g.25977 Transcript_12712/m.25977 type:complete len:380 (+) Transcript_12712:182-1321(+)